MDFNKEIFISRMHGANVKITQFVYLKTALHVAGGTTTLHQERVQLYVQHLVFVTPLLLPAAIAGGSHV